MTKKKFFLWFLCAYLLLLFGHFIFVFAFQKNENIPISSAIEICSIDGTECISEHNFMGVKEYDLNKKIDVKIIKHKKEFLFLKSTFIFFMIMFLVFLIKTKLFEKIDYKMDFKTLFLFSLLANYKNFYLISNNVLDISLYISFLVIFIFCIIYFIIYYILKYIFKKQALSAYLALMGVFILTRFGENLAPCFIQDIFLAAALYILVVFITIYYFSHNLIKFLKVFSLTLLILCFSNAILKYQSVFKTVSQKQKPAAVSSYMPDKKLNRDIYILLFDMYSGDEILKSIGFDNHEFISYLENKNFMVFKNINSNYTKTRTSIPSFLNLDYIENLKYHTPNDALNSSLIFQIAHKNGYKIYYFNSCSEFTIKKEPVDYIYNSTLEIKNLNTFNLIVSGSIFDFLIEYFNEVNLIKALDNFLDNHIFKEKHKKFIFAHFMMPHFPYVYDENGNKNTIDKINDITQGNGLEVLNREGYISYLKYTNKNIIKIIDKIIEKSKKEPIIIIMGDHGLRMKHYLVDDMNHIDELLADELNLESYFNTFLAYYNPDMDKDLYKNTTLLGFYKNFAYDVFNFKTKKIEEKRFYNIYSAAIKDLSHIKGFYVKK